MFYSINWGFGVLGFWGFGVKIEQAGRSLRVFCCSQQQKDAMLCGGCTVAGVEVANCTEPRTAGDRAKAQKTAHRGLSVECRPTTRSPRSNRRAGR